MANFLCWTNNGVYAVVTTEVLRQIQEWDRRSIEPREADGPFLEPYPKPIFTFSDLPGLRGVVTGSVEDKDRVLAGHSVENSAFYVPFSGYSGSAELLFRAVLDTGDNDFRFVTTLGEAMDTFELIRSPESVAA